jgi:hypothetical protein
MQLPGDWCQGDRVPWHALIAALALIGCSAVADVSVMS